MHILVAVFLGIGAAALLISVVLMPIIGLNGGSIELIELWYRFVGPSLLLAAALGYQFQRMARIHRLQSIACLLLGICVWALLLVWMPPRESMGMIHVAALTSTIASGRIAQKNAIA